MIRAFIRFYLRPTVPNWRKLRRACRARLPEKDKGLLT